MTAEVAVLNKFGIALAADSAVTVEHWHQSKLKTKVLNTANKLFTLSKFEPVGIMYYNAVTLGGIPWETVIKSYRKKLNKNKFATLEEYCNDFFTWLSNNIMFSEAQCNVIVRTNLIRKFISLESGLKTKQAFVQKLDKAIADLNKLDDIPNFESPRNIIQQYRQQIDVSAQVVLKKSWLGGQKRKLQEYVGLLLSKKIELPSYAGIVICGFGDDEHLPKLREFMTDIIVCGRVRYWLRNSYQVDERNPSEVVPLADGWGDQDADRGNKSRLRRGRPNGRFEANSGNAAENT